jgi:hypothetical protein
VATGCRNYSIEELSKLLIERHRGPWHLLFVNSAWWLWYRNYKQTMSATIVASSPNWKDRAAARSARCVARDIGSTYCLANVAICWPAKTVDATDYRPFNLLSALISRMGRAGTVMSAERWWWHTLR